MIINLLNEVNTIYNRKMNIEYLSTLVGNNGSINVDEPNTNIPPNKKIHIIEKDGLCIHISDWFNNDFKHKNEFIDFVIKNKNNYKNYKHIYLLQVTSIRFNVIFEDEFGKGNDFLKLHNDLEHSLIIAVQPCKHILPKKHQGVDIYSIIYDTNTLKITEQGF